MCSGRYHSDISIVLFKSGSPMDFAMLRWTRASEDSALGFFRFRDGTRIQHRTGKS